MNLTALICTLGAFTALAAQDAADAIWIGKPDEAKSCATQKAISLDQAARELKGAQIEVLSKKKVPDNLPRIQMCGADKGTKNAFLIHKKDLERASSLGFAKIN